MFCHMFMVQRSLVMPTTTSKPALLKRLIGPSTSGMLPSSFRVRSIILFLHRFDAHTSHRRFARFISYTDRLIGKLLQVSSDALRLLLHVLIAIRLVYKHKSDNPKSCLKFWHVSLLPNFKQFF